MKLCEEFLNKIEDEEKDTNGEIFSNYFGFYNLSILTKQLFKKDENEKIVNKVNDSLIGFRNDVE